MFLIEFYIKLKKKEIVGFNMIFLIFVFKISDMSNGDFYNELLHNQSFSIFF